MSKYNARAILQGLGLEENDLNININAEHEGDKGEGEDVGEENPFTADAAETVETAPVEETPAAPVEEDTSGTPEAAELDIADAGDEVEDTTEKVEDVNEAVEGLEGIALTLARISYEQIEVSPLAAQMLNDHYDFVTRKFPALQSAKNRVASFEDFSTSPDRAVTVSLENVMDGIKKGGQAAIQFLKDLWERFMQLIRTVRQGTAAMKKKAEALKTAKAAERKNINLPGMLTELDSKGAKAITELTELVDLLGKARLETLIASLKAGGNPLSAIKEANKDIAAVSSTRGGFLGGFKVAVTSLDVPRVSPLNQGEGKTIDSFDESTIRAMADGVIKLATAIEYYNGKENSRKAVNDAIIKELSAGNGGGEDAGRIARFKAAREASKVWGQQCAFEQAVIRRAVSVGNAVNNVLAASAGKGGSEGGGKKTTENKEETK